MRAIGAYMQIFKASVIVILALPAVACRSVDRGVGWEPKVTGAVVHGLIYIEVADPAAVQGKRKIFVPNVSVYLKNRADGKQTPPVTTNTRGWFVTPTLAAGAYSICWEASGFESGCMTDREVLIQSAVVTPVPVAIHAKGKPIFERVTFSNGAPCNFSAPMFGLERNATVTILVANQTAVGKPIPTNISGEFILPDLPESAVALRADCDGMKTDIPNLKATQAGALEVTIRNTGPRIENIYAGSADRPRFRAAPGETIPVTVTVRDAKQRSLHYFWHPSESSSRFSSKDSATVLWTLPRGGGTHTVYVMVEDNGGGHTVGRVDVVTGSTAVMFSGTVTELSGMPVAGAEVTVNSQAASTNVLVRISRGVAAGQAASVSRNAVCGNRRRATGLRTSVVQEGLVTRPYHTTKNSGVKNGHASLANQASSFYGSSVRPVRS